MSVTQDSTGIEVSIRIASPSMLSGLSSKQIVKIVDMELGDLRKELLDAYRDADLAQYEDD